MKRIGLLGEMSWIHKVAAELAAAIDVPLVRVADAIREAGLQTEDSDVPLFDTTRLHAQKAVELALA